MDTMRKMMLVGCCLAACICVMDTRVTARVEQGVDTKSASGDSAPSPLRSSLFSEDQSAYVFPLPPTARLVEDDGYGGARGEGLCPDEADDQLIYSNLGSPTQQMVYRPPIRYTRVADDIFTNAVATCEIDKYLIRVNGGVPNGWFQKFTTRVALTTYCPSTDYWGPTIAGTDLSFTRTADINDIWELEVDFCDPNIGICADRRACRFVDDAFESGAGCSDGSECMERTAPVIIPSQVWLRVEFSTGTAGWLVGAPPIRGFSTDQYDNMFTGCATWFGGYPAHPHSSFYAQFYSPPTCPTHFLAYLAFNPDKPAYTEFGTDDVLMADDIELIINDCELSTVEIGTQGTNGRYEIDFDLRTFPSDPPIPGSEFHWVSDRRSGRGNLEVARLEFPPGMNLGRDFWLTWQANKDDSGVINVGYNQAGGECRIDIPPTGQQACNHYFGFFGPPNAPPGEWAYQPDGTTFGIEVGEGGDAVFYVAVYCRGDAPIGPCCMAQPDIPAQNPACLDNVPVTSCLQGRWLNAGDEGKCEYGQDCNTVDQDCENWTCAFPPCICDPIIECPATFNLGICPDEKTECNVVDQDCTGDACVGEDCTCDTADPWARIGQPACGTHACCMPDNNCDDLPRDECVAILEEDTGNPARWNRGDWCGYRDQRCPFFACYDAKVACSNCHDPFHECHSDQECKDWLDDPGATCNLVEQTCNIPKGCTDVWCCDWVCRIPSNQFCCSTGWDCTCRAQSEFCPGPPANNECHDEEAARGAIAIRLDAAPLPLRYRGTASSNHENATSGPTDICCFKQGTDRLLPGSVWYKFRPEETSSVRIQTCDTPGAIDALDSVIQVFAAPFTDIGICDDGSQCSVGDQDCPPTSCADPPCVCHDDDERLCQYLEVIACNDDAGGQCGDGGGNADLCIPLVQAGVLYYIVVGASGNDQLGTYKLTIEQPCDPDDIAPANSFCDGAGAALPVVPNPYDLAEATLFCPAEPCVPMMSSDIWFDHRPACTGNLVIRTCDSDPLTPEEDTTLAVYEGVNCPPAPDDPATPEQEGALLGCNDDAAASEYARVTLGIPQTCASVGGDCDVDGDCPTICTVGVCTMGTCTIGLDVCTTDDDCDEGATCAYDTCTSDGDCEEGICTQDACADDTDCDIGICSSGDQCSVSEEDCADGFSCVRAGDCGPGICESACWPGSLVVVPASSATYYKIRLGGSRGSVPAGEFTITCDEQDCNQNLIPDPIDILNCPEPDQSCKDCNFNGVLDLCDVVFNPEEWEDCNANGKPDRCEMSSIDCGEGYFCPVDCAVDIVPPGGNCVPDECDCPEGVMTWATTSDPPDGIIDARQPHPVDDGTTPQGISVITVQGPPLARKKCFTLCETQVDGTPNDIQSVVEFPPMTYTITLERPLAAGAVTKITYTDETGTASSGVYTSLPADSDASGRSQDVDIPALVSCCLNGSCPPPHGAHSCDINHSGTNTAEDILRLIDALNGGGAFAAWDDQIPYDGGECD
ncbi:MAG: hypothetical protein ACYTFA_01265 [Planctomycetota bacterium]|jgi:hypothetical protein